MGPEIEDQRAMEAVASKGAEAPSVGVNAGGPSQEIVDDVDRCAPMEEARGGDDGDIGATGLVIGSKHGARGGRHSDYRR